jgi:hypothetical protein
MEKYPQFVKIFAMRQRSLVFQIFLEEIEEIAEKQKKKGDPAGKKNIVFLDQRLSGIGGDESENYFAQRDREKIFEKIVAQGSKGIIGHFGRHRHNEKENQLELGVRRDFFAIIVDFFKRRKSFEDRISRVVSDDIAQNVSDHPAGQKIERHGVASPNDDGDRHQRRGRKRRKHRGQSSETNKNKNAQKLVFSGQIFKERHDFREKRLELDRRPDQKSDEKERNSDGNISFAEEFH